MSEKFIPGEMSSYKNEESFTAFQAAWKYIDENVNSSISDSHYVNILVVLEFLGKIGIFQEPEVKSLKILVVDKATKGV